MRNRTTVIRGNADQAGPRPIHRTEYANIEHLHRIFAKSQAQKLYPRYENWLGTHRTIMKKAA